MSWLSVFTGGTGAIMIGGVVLLILGVIVTGVFMFRSYINSFDIAVTVLKKKRDGYTLTQEKGRQKSTSEGGNKLELLTTKGMYGTKARIDFPGEDYFDTKDGEDHIFLLEKEGDQYIPVQVDLEPSQPRGEDGEVLQIKILSSDERQAALTELQAAEDKYQETGFWDVMYDKIIPIVMVGVAGLVFVIMLNQMGGAIAESSESLADTSENLNSATQYCQNLFQNSTQANTAGGEGLLPGQTPSGAETTPTGGGE